MSQNEIEEEKRISEFEVKTIEAFHFLETEYGYTKENLGRRDFDYPLERAVYIRYFHNKVAVEIIWSIGDGNMGVGLYEIKNGKIPDNASFYGNKGFTRAINLDSLVRMKTNGEIDSLLPQRKFDISFAEICRRAEKSIEMIRKNMDGILETYAERLKKYATEILKGDTSIFPKVQEYHRKFWGVNI
jgi:hypothetical protein